MRGHSQSSNAAITAEVSDAERRCRTHQVIQMIQMIQDCWTYCGTYFLAAGFAPLPAAAAFRFTP